MGNTSELVGSLDTYASSFGFKVSGKAQSVKMSGNIYAAWLNATQGGQSVILMMFATQDLRKHYICEASFPESRRSVGEQSLTAFPVGAPANRSPLRATGAMTAIKTLAEKEKPSCWISGVHGTRRAWRTYRL